MNRLTFKWASKLTLCVLCMLIVSGCAGLRRGAREARPVSSAEMRDYFGQAQDARRFWITIYESESGPRFTGAHRLHAERIAVLDFQSPRNSPVPVIPLRFRTPDVYDALIDTTSHPTWITFDLAQRAGVIPVGPPAYRLNPAHVPDPVPGFLSVATRIVLDELYVETALVYVKMSKGRMPELMRGQDRVRAPVVLGSEFLRAFYFVQFNFPGRVVAFATTTPYKPDEDRLLASVPMRELDGTFAVIGQIDGVEMPFLLDSAGDFELAVGMGEELDVRQISIGDLVFRRPETQYTEDLNLGLPMYPRIGTRLLSRYIVTFDNHAKLIHFERP